MIDNELRIQRMQAEANDKETAVILLDVVIGYGAHPDPAAELGKTIKRINKDLKNAKRSIAFVASVTGTEDDPQVFSHTFKTLEKAGVMVCTSNAQAARLAATLVEKKAPKRGK
jgi:FdrA protein